MKDRTYIRIVTGTTIAYMVCLSAFTFHETHQKEKDTSNLSQTENQIVETTDHYAAIEGREAQLSMNVDDTNDTLIKVIESTEPAVDAAMIPEDPRASVLKHYTNLGVVAGLTTYLNVFEEPNSNSPSIGKVLNYTGVDVIKDCNNGWLEIQSKDIRGYIDKTYVRTGEEAETLAIAHAKQLVEVDANVLNVREGPSLDTPVLTKLNVNERYEYLGEEGDWIKIHVLQGLEGYVNAAFVKVDYFLEDAIMFSEDGSISNLRRNIINSAWEYYGGKYVWGGTELGGGVDCSGFMLRIFEKYGINLHRVSKEQASDGEEVTFEEMRPGDLVFYNTRGDFVSHVALYIGSGKIIHAASEEKGICVNEWDYIPPTHIRNVIGD
ncbi:MAG: NlpC/P60 family protein [Lachnospiraceae bacterium]